jgi:hypothetical protein
MTSSGAVQVSDSIGQRREGWSASGILTLRGRPAPVTLTVADSSPMLWRWCLNSACTVDRLGRGVRQMPGMAARRHSAEITARATRT